MVSFKQNYFLLSLFSLSTLFAPDRSLEDFEVVEYDLLDVEKIDYPIIPRKGLFLAFQELLTNKKNSCDDIYDVFRSCLCLPVDENSSQVLLEMEGLALQNLLNLIVSRPNFLLPEDKSKFERKKKDLDNLLLGKKYSSVFFYNSIVQLYSALKKKFPNIEFPKERNSLNDNFKRTNYLHNLFQVAKKINSFELERALQFTFLTAAVASFYSGKRLPAEEFSVSRQNLVQKRLIVSIWVAARRLSQI